MTFKPYVEKDHVISSTEDIATYIDASSPEWDGFKHEDSAHELCGHHLEYCKRACGKAEDNEKRLRGMFNAWLDEYRVEAKAVGGKDLTVSSHTGVEWVHQGDFLVTDAAPSPAGETVIINGKFIDVVSTSLSWCGCIIRK